MASQRNLDIIYIECAVVVAELSKAKRAKVGAIIVGENGIIAEGYNGTPTGFDNDCEIWNGFDAVTKPEVLHAESNAIMKVAKSTNSSKGATLYITHAPCFECAKLIIQAGIARVVFDEAYRITDGIKLLEQADISVERMG